jgi:hypothetical protein
MQEHIASSTPGPIPGVHQGHQGAPVTGEVQQGESPQQDRGGASERSGYRSGFGEELPVAVYQSILLGFAGMLAVAWLTFGRTTGTDLDLGVVSVLCAVFLLLPLIMHRVAAARAARDQPDLHRFLAAPFETATGPLSPREAWLQVALIPVALAVAAVAIGGVYAWLG